MIKKFLKQIRNNKFSGDMVWNLLSLFFLGISGVLFNLIIARNTGADVLGVFNQVTAIYFFISQLAVGGIHLSVTKYLSEHHRTPGQERSAIAVAGMILTLVISVGASLILLSFSGFLGKVLDSDSVITGLICITPGLMFFACNKLLLGILNGLVLIKPIAIFQSVRYLSVLAYLLLFMALGFEGSYYPLTITLSEGTLFVFLLVFVFTRTPLFTGVRLFEPDQRRRLVFWMKRHFLFGYKAVFSGIIAELNAKVDLLVLGYYLGDREVGFYSFAIVFIDGIYQAIAVFRTNVNPLISKSVAENDRASILAARRKVFRFVYRLSGVLAIGVLVCFPVICKFVVGWSFFHSYIPLIILLSSLFLTSGYIAFGNILSQSGKPGIELSLSLVTVIANLVMNIFLVPVMGMTGAALSTGISFLVYCLIMKLLVKRHLGISI